MTIRGLVAAGEDATVLMDEFGEEVAPEALGGALGELALAFLPHAVSWENVWTLTSTLPSLSEAVLRNRAEERF